MNFEDIVKQNWQVITAPDPDMLHAVGQRVREELRAYIRSLLEAQREACGKRMDDADEHLSDIVRNTPLVEIK